MEKKLLGKILVPIFLLPFCIGCQKQDNLIGNWERYGDSYAGMKISVVKEGESFKALITEVPDSCKLIGGFEIGDVKWKNIKPTSENKYEFEDLGKSGVGSSNIESNYALSNLELLSDSELCTRKFSKGNETIGTAQKWKRTLANNKP